MKHTSSPTTSLEAQSLEDKVLSFGADCLNLALLSELEHAHLPEVARKRKGAFYLVEYERLRFYMQMLLHARPHRTSPEELQGYIRALEKKQPECPSYLKEVYTDFLQELRQDVQGMKVASSISHLDPS